MLHESICNSNIILIDRSVWCYGSFFDDESAKLESQPHFNKGNLYNLCSAAIDCAELLSILSRKRSICNLHVIKRRQRGCP